MTDAERRRRYLAKHARYNASRKGRARYAKYEAAHPERTENRWEPTRNGLRHEEGVA